MNSSEYLLMSARTESPKMYDNVNINTLHGVIGLTGEAGELIDCIKKAMFYGHELDKVNIKEELGDCLWYIAQILRSEGWSFDEVMKENIDKLIIRYPEQFTIEDSIERKDKNGTKTI
jgi:NTP pyrophosphatase (non-canonical NTP hydrolase)